jgi:hypothetical protein
MAYFIGEDKPCQAHFLAGDFVAEHVQRECFEAESLPDLHKIFRKVVDDFLVLFLLQIE